MAVVLRTSTAVDDRGARRARRPGRSHERRGATKAARASKAATRKRNASTHVVVHQAAKNHVKEAAAKGLDSLQRLGSRTELLEAAAGYARRGWRVLPLHTVADGKCSCGTTCSSAGKHPRTKNGVKDATSDLGAINKWWSDWPDANVGVATGNGLAVLDIDPDKGGENSLRELLGADEPWDTSVVATGGGGLHFYFTSDKAIRNRVGVRPGIDVRGQAGYVVAPPSNHVSGGSYIWQKKTALAEWPSFDFSRREPKAEPISENGIAAGKRNAKLASLAGTMRRRGMSEPAIAAALLEENKRCLPPLAENEVRRIAASISKYAPAPGQEPADLQADATSKVDDREPDGMEPKQQAALLEDLRTFLSGFVVLSAAQLVALVLWVLHTHALDATDVTPYLHITSAEKRSGKTRLLEVLGLLVARPWLTGRVTAAVLVRKVDAEQPTLLLDEGDAAFKSGDEYAEALRGLLNTGHRRGGTSSLCVGQGANITYKDFSTFGAKAIAGIGKLPDTVADRSIKIELKRRAPGELVRRFRLRKVAPEAAALHERIERWASANLEALTGIEPDLPEELGDRAQDAWEALFAIADLVGAEWPHSARRASIALSGGDAELDDSLGVRLLEDIRRIFVRRGTDRITTADLVADLVSDDESPWVELGKGKPLAAAGLARLLKPFGISSRTIWLGDDPDEEPEGRRIEKSKKGYHRGLFEDAWVRYLGSQPSDRQDPMNTAPNDISELTGDRDLTGPESSQNADEQDLLTALTADSPSHGEGRASDADSRDEPLLRAALDTSFITEAIDRAEQASWLTCRMCGGTDSWTRPEGTRICARCHPSPLATTGGAA